MYNYTLHHRRKSFCCYCLQAFSTEEVLKHHFKDCFKINGRQRIIMPKKQEYVKLRNYESEIKSLLRRFGIVPVDNEKQTSEDSYTNKYQKHIACSYGYE